MHIINRCPNIEIMQPDNQSISRRSIVLINTGDGKGKSSAAFGVMVRAWARGWKVGVVQFVKSGKWKTGERKLAEQLQIEWHTLGDGFTWESKDLDKTAEVGRHAWAKAKQMLESDNFQLLILDELTYAINYNWIDVEEVTAAIKSRGKNTNVIITGRNASDQLISIADTVTEMLNVKHAYDQGVKARKGIEY
ncbi:MAG: cob(I)yrinic acid a,c-diamide adenosyltransferase [Actinobacteria bacterium]|nr:cob(I)yrinic acid a,c-diamide adenosyltransferase [Actinomycetota bacterium]